MKYRVLASLALITLLAGFISGSASAHVLKSDGTIGAVLHIEPDDNPSSGKPVSYVLSFTDDANKLDISQCDCMIHVQSNGQTIASNSLEVTDPTDSINTYTFPKAAVYTLRVTGKPKTANAFQAFTLNYLVRVNGGSGALGGSQPFPKILWLGLGLVVGIIVLAAYKLNSRNSVDYKNKQESK